MDSYIVEVAILYIAYLAKEMGKIAAFTISLFGDNPAYAAGSNIEGKVILELNEPKKVQGICITLSGIAYVDWREDRPESGHGAHDHHHHRHHHHHGHSQMNTIHYHDSQAIFNDIVLQLWGNGRDAQEIAAGKYEFPFKFQLPSDLVLPTSFESGMLHARLQRNARGHGYIRYFLAASMSRPWKFNHVAKRAITVVETIDTNLPHLKQSLSSSNEKTICCLCCASGPISLSAMTDRGAYCPGESIAISTEVENHSSRRITAVQASLKQEIAFFARGNYMHRTKLIQRIKGQGVEPGGTSNWSNELLPIPATVPSIGTSCRVLNVSYFLIVTLDIPGAIDLHVALPITIGSVPFRGTQPIADNTATVPSPQSSVPPPAGNPYPPPTGPSVIQNAYPPVDGTFNYAAAYPPVNIGDDQYTLGETQYAPVYGFVTNYQYAPPPSYSDSIVKVQGPEEENN